MTRNHLRVLFALPVVFVVLGILGIETGPSTWPQPAQDYFRWYLSQGLSATSYFLNRAAFVGLLGLGASTVGLVLFWKPARYTYVACLLLTFGGDLSDLPVLVEGWPKLFESLAQTLIGVNIALIFTSPGAAYFERVVDAA